MRRWLVLARVALAWVALADAEAAPGPPAATLAEQLPPTATMAEQLRAAERQGLAGAAAVQAAQQQALAAARRADALADARIAAAAGLRAAEEANAAASTAMFTLAQQRREAERRLAQQGANLAPLLPLIERLSLYPAETLLAVPASPEQTLRGVTVLRGITVTMQREATALLRQRAEVARLTAAMADAAPGLAAAEQAQAAQAAALDAEIEAARQTMSAAERAGLQAAQAIAAAASRARSLREVIAQLEAAQALAAAKAQAQAAALRARSAAAARPGHRAAVAVAAPDLIAAPGFAGLGLALGRGMAPVTGAVIRAFGAGSDAGPATGVSYQPAPAARVVAPCAGAVVFAGPFRSYGLLLILDCGGGYHFVLAGLDRLDTAIGRIVRVGEPVGLMPGWDPRTSTSRPALYVELRHDGAAIDPVSFLQGHGLQGRGLQGHGLQGHGSQGHG